MLDPFTRTKQAPARTYAGPRLQVGAEQAGIPALTWPRAGLAQATLEGAVRGELDGSRGGRSYVHYRDEGSHRATPLSGTQLNPIRGRTRRRRSTRWPFPDT